MRHKVKLDGFRCLRCDHRWYPSTRREPEVCPRCKSRYWNRERGKEHA